MVDSSKHLKMNITYIKTLPVIEDSEFIDSLIYSSDIKKNKRSLPPYPNQVSLGAFAGAIYT